jgi:hypothetical protein
VKTGNARPSLGPITPLPEKKYWSQKRPKVVESFQKGMPIGIPGGGKVFLDVDHVLIGRIPNAVGPIVQSSTIFPLAARGPLL